MSNQYVSVIANMGMPSNIKGVGGGARLKAKDDHKSQKDEFVERKVRSLDSSNQPFIETNDHQHYLNQGVIDSQSGQTAGLGTNITTCTIQVKAIDESSGEPIQDFPYCIKKNGNTYMTGRTDRNGEIIFLETDVPEEFEVFWGDEALAKMDVDCDD